VIAANELLKLAIEGHGGLPRWEQVSRFRVAAGRDLGAEGQARPAGVVLEGETRAQRLTIAPVPAARPVRHMGAVPADDRDRRGCEIQK
jgi:hypothetical protein